MKSVESNNWESEMVEPQKNEPASPQLLLLTTDYTSSSNQQILKDISSESDLNSQSQLLLDQVASLSPFPKEFLSQDAKHKNEELNSLLVLKADTARSSTNSSNFGDVLTSITKTEEHFSPSSSLDNLPDEINSPPENTFRSTPIIFEQSSLNGFECSDKEELEHDDLETRADSDLTTPIQDDDNLKIHEDISLPNALCSVGWDTDSEEESSENVSLIIKDKPVLSRARATLPSNHLIFKHVVSSSEIGVFAARPLPKRCQLGPLDGAMVQEECDKELSCAVLQLSIIKAGQCFALNNFNDEVSNWTKYVRPARKGSEQNLSLVQKKESLYFITCRPIKEGEELRVWYSLSYASARFLPLLWGPRGIKWRCPLCNFKCVSSNTMKQHMQEHAALKKLVDLGNHGHDEVEKTKQPQSQNSSSKRFLARQDSSGSSHSSSQNGFNSREWWWCSHCSLCFNTATTLNFHMLAHAADDLEAGADQNCNHCHVSHDKSDDCVGQENKPLNCNLCPRNFSSTASLACHIKSHASEKKYECPICSKVFPKVLELKKHIHSHAKNGIYTCNVCSKEFKTYKNIRKHIRTCHSDKEYRCETCDKLCSNPDSLKAHKLTYQK